MMTMMTIIMKLVMKFMNQALIFPEQLLVFSALLQEVSDDNDDDDDDGDDEEEDHIDYDDGDDEGEEVLGSTKFTE